MNDEGHGYSFPAPSKGWPQFCHLGHRLTDAGTCSKPETHLTEELPPRSRSRSV